MRIVKKTVALLLLALLAGCASVAEPSSAPTPPVTASIPAPSGGGHVYGRSTEEFADWYDGQKGEGVALLREQGELLQAIADELCSDKTTQQYAYLVLEADGQGNPYAVEWAPFGEEESATGTEAILSESMSENLRTLYVLHPCPVSWGEAAGCVIFHYAADQLSDAYASVVSFDLVYAPDGGVYTGAVVEELGDGWYTVGDYHAMAGI